jgi:hypothetical protein
VTRPAHHCPAQLPVFARITQKLNTSLLLSVSVTGEEKILSLDAWN